MKNITVILFLFISATVHGQGYPDYGFEKVRIVETDKIIQAQTKLVSNNPHVKPDRFYYWYSANAIHATQGGFSGKLLNGSYNEYYMNGNLKQQGFFKNGVKVGVWKDWKPDGTLTEIANWKNGIISKEGSLSFLERVNIFKKKNKQTDVDTLNKGNK